MKKKIILVVLILILLYSVGGVFYNVYYKENNNKINITKVDSIKNYTYTLKSNSTELQKSEFKVLKNNLESKDIDYQEYAKSISKLFIIDLYTITNKINKYDVGGISYIYPDSILNYKENVEDTIYKYVEDNTSKDRMQELPEVNSINVESISDIKYKIDSTEYGAYKLKLKWTYVKDLGYDTESDIIVIKKDKYLYIAEKN